MHKEKAGFSYTHAHTRREKYKESDHDAVQIVLRGALIPKPQPRTTLRLDTLREPAVRAAMSSHLAEAGDQTADTADELWHRILKVGMAHQRKLAKARGALRDETLKKIRRLQEKLKCMPQGGGYRKVASTLERYKTKLRLLAHKGRKGDETNRRKDTVKTAGEMAESLHACTMPHGSKGRVTLTKGRVMGKAYAPLRLTAPADQAEVDSCLRDLQGYADLVFGRWWLTADAAAQPPARVRGWAPARTKAYASSLGATPSLHHGQRPREAPLQTLLRQVCQGGLPSTGYGQGTPLAKP